MAVAQHDGLGGVRLHGKFTQKNIGKQGRRFDVAARPTGVQRGDAGDAALAHFRRWQRERHAEHEHSARQLGQRRVIPAAFGAARDLPVQGLILAAILLEQACNDAAPLISRMRILHADRGKTSRQASCVRGKTKRAARVYRHHLIDAVAKEKATVKRRDARGLERQILAVQIAYGQRLGHFDSGGRLPRYLNHSSMLSTMRVQRPPAGSAASATSGERMTTSPFAAVTVNSPMLWPAAIGAMSGSLTLALVCRLASWPRPTVT